MKTTFLSFSQEGTQNIQICLSHPGTNWLGCWQNIHKPLGGQQTGWSRCPEHFSLIIIFLPESDCSLALEKKWWMDNGDECSIEPTEILNQTKCWTQMVALHSIVFGTFHWNPKNGWPKVILDLSSVTRVLERLTSWQTTIQAVHGLNKSYYE